MEGEVEEGEVKEGEEEGELEVEIPLQQQQRELVLYNKLSCPAGCMAMHCNRSI